MNAKPYTNRELDELLTWVKTKARELPERERTKALVTVFARTMASFGEIVGQFADMLSETVEADDATDGTQISPRSFVRIHDGRGRRRPCPWCPSAPPAPPRATHLGLLEGAGVTSGCEWHMRAWVKYGFRRKLPAPRVRR